MGSILSSIIERLSSSSSNPIKLSVACACFKSSVDQVDEKEEEIEEEDS